MFVSVKSLFQILKNKQEKYLDSVMKGKSVSA